MTKARAKTRVKANPPSRARLLLQPFRQPLHQRFERTQKFDEIRLYGSKHCGH